MSASVTDNQQVPLMVLVNGEAQIEYHRGRPLAQAQRAYLDQMDEQMDAGIQLGGVPVARPGSLQRAQFIAVQVIQALQTGNEALVAAGCAYLAIRLPDLTQIKARLIEGGFSAELVFNQPYVKEVAVNFTPRRLS
jgi:hypothetical protein